MLLNGNHLGKSCSLASMIVGFSSKVIFWLTLTLVLGMISALPVLVLSRDAIKHVSCSTHAQ